MITQIVLTLAAALIWWWFDFIRMEMDLTTLFILCLMVFSTVCFLLQHIGIKEYGFIKYLLYW